MRIPFTRRALAGRRPAALVRLVARLLLAVSALAGCGVLAPAGVARLAGTAPDYAGPALAEVRVALPQAGVYGGRGVIDASGSFDVELDGTLDAGSLPAVTDLRIGGADLFAVAVSDRGARLETAEIGVFSNGAEIGSLRFGNVAASVASDGAGVVRALLTYSDRAVALDGVARGPGTTVRYDANLPRGWSYLVVRRGEAAAGEAVPYTVSSANASGLWWSYAPSGATSLERRGR